MVIDSQPDLKVVGQADDGVTALELLADLSADVVLMDVRMPQLDGIQATRQLLDSADLGGTEAPKVIMLTTYDLDEYLLTAIKAGASGFLLKNAPPEDLLSAIRTVQAGDAVVAPSATRRLLAHVAIGASPAETVEHPWLDRLTEREREVMRLIAAGNSNAEIALELYLSETTVKTHVRHILTKLGLRDRVQVVVFAFESGLVGG